VDDHLTGRFHVRTLRANFADARRLLPRSGDRAELRRHVLKLRFWPKANAREAAGQVVDLDWSWIQACKGLDIGELRIHDVIGGNDNLRVIFFVGPERESESLSCIWVLAVMQKKRDDFTANNLATFRARRLLVLERFYQGDG
jgi:hypothetical protein